MPKMNMLDEQQINAIINKVMSVIETDDETFFRGMLRLVAENESAANFGFFISNLLGGGERRIESNQLAIMAQVSTNNQILHIN